MHRSDRCEYGVVDLFVAIRYFVSRWMNRVFDDLYLARIVYHRSAFFWFCNDERTKVKALNPQYGVGDIAKELGRQWSDVDPAIKSKYETMAEKDKKRYEVVSRVSAMQFDWILTNIRITIALTGNDRVQKGVQRRHADGLNHPPRRGRPGTDGR